MIIDAYPESGRNYFAVELYNPFNRTIDLEDFELDIVDTDEQTGEQPEPSHTVTVIVSNSGKFDIRTKDLKIDPKLQLFGGRWEPADESKAPRDRRGDPDETKPPVYIGWTRDSTLLLKRNVPKDSSEWIYVDRQEVDRRWGAASRERYFERDVRDPPNWHLVYQTLEERDTSEADRSRVTLGIRNDIDPDEFRDRDHDFRFYGGNTTLHKIGYSRRHSPDFDDWAARG